MTKRLNTMKKLLKTAAFVVATAFATNTFAADITLKLAHSWPKGFPLFATSVDSLAEKLKSKCIAVINTKRRLASLTL